MEAPYIFLKYIFNLSSSRMDFFFFEEKVKNGLALDPGGSLSSKQI